MKIVPIVLAAVLAAALAGCAHGRPAFVVEMNGRRLEFERFESGSIPRGIEVSRFDSASMDLTGDEPIVVNGFPVQVAGDQVTIGGRRFTVDGDARVVVDGEGTIQVEMPPVLPVGPPAPK